MRLENGGYAVTVRALPRAHVPRIATRIDGVDVFLHRRVLAVACEAHPQHT